MDARLIGLLRVLVRNMGGGFCIVILLGEKVSAYSLFVIYIYIYIYIYMYRKTFKLCAIHFVGVIIIISIRFQSNFN